MKQFFCYVASIVLMAACSQVKDPEAQQALGNYTQFVDSIYATNETWKTSIDTDVVESPYPGDTTHTLTIIDTIITQPDKKAKSLVVADYWGKVIVEKYEPLEAAVETKLEKMDKKMKEQYEAAKKKFEAMRDAK